LGWYQFTNQRDLIIFNSYFFMSPIRPVGPDAPRRNPKADAKLLEREGGRTKRSLALHTETDTHTLASARELEGGRERDNGSGGEEK
jgi:hypothetical protein